MREHPLVLLIDDEEDFLEIASVKLQSEGFEIVATRTVDEALSKAEELLPDIILSDIYMPPGPNGWDLAMAVRRDARLKNIKFAFFTSLRDPMFELEHDLRADVLESIRGIPIFSKAEDIAHLGMDIAKIIK